ncbi:MAG: tRNA guanosine(34) transglycosylase Tgt [Halobacteriovoraceae bacterium]|nr:tRNA guanosine(34) transglycosylase Tgt [Halobacteriovoraceae bacterium]|tara:strand:- start:3374 stop:4483 length:1110 start_codon:yes stop_codon:yes gene_type:complete
MKNFTLQAQSGQARAGLIETAHGPIETPIFMPVGTRASVKSLWQEELDELGAQIILGNTYHLYLRPGHELVEKMGGLHKFMQWNKPILTDSGGFQVFSLSDLNKITEEGVEFQSHIDGSRHMLSPEKSMEIQKALGSDIVMIFDECPKLPASKDTLRESMELTLRWAKRCRDYELQDHQSLFAIVQGGLHLDLRQECMERMMEMDFPGFALGGLSVGEKNEEMVEFLNEFSPCMPSEKPRYLMGVGKPLDVLNGIRAGIDMFDCVLPTRNARNGQFLTTHGPLNIKKARYLEDSQPPDPTCDCKVCSKYSRSYIRHLFNVGEYLAGQMISYHNLYFYLRMVKKARAAILADKFDEFYKEFYNAYTENRW